MIEDATVGGNPTIIPRSEPEGSQVRQVANRQSIDPGFTRCDEATEFGAWMLATRRKSRGRSRGGAGFSSARGSHMGQRGRVDGGTVDFASRNKSNGPDSFDGRQVEGRGLGVWHVEGIASVKEGVGASHIMLPTVRLYLPFPMTS